MFEFLPSATNWALHAVAAGVVLFALGWTAVRRTSDPARRLQLSRWVVRAGLFAAVSVMFVQRAAIQHLADATQRTALTASALRDGMQAAALDSPAVFARLSPYLFEVGRVDFFADLPNKHDAAMQSRSEASKALLNLVASTQSELILQTPYLVMSRQARGVFRSMHHREQAPLIYVSTNSLAATDAFPVYAMSHKYKRLYLRELGFEIHEFKPFPVSAPIDLAATGATPDAGQPLPAPKDYDRDKGPVPLKRAGLRIGLHAKCMVIDERIGVVGSHNFDPRSDDYNTESMVVIHDTRFAQALAASIRGDMAPENAWLIAPRAKLPVLAQLNYNLGKFSEKLPIFDVWPLPYATSYELKPGCQPLHPGAADFDKCYDAVGDFPEVNLSLKSIYTRFLTAFGSSLIPIL